MQLLIIISSPSGGGKTTVCKKLLESTDSPLYKAANFSISFTTRSPRGGEVNGKEYFFVSKEKFSDMIKNNEFLEYAEVFGNFYGTHIKNNSELHTIFDIDYQGAMQIKAKMPALSIFLLPPNLETLEQRIKNRGDINTEQIQTRISKAPLEIAQSIFYDYIIVNEDLELTFQKVSAIINSEIIKAKTLNIKQYKDCSQILKNANSK